LYRKKIAEVATSFTLIGTAGVLFLAGCQEQKPGPSVIPSKSFANAADNVIRDAKANLPALRNPATTSTVGSAGSTGTAGSAAGGGAADLNKGAASGLNLGNRNDQDRHPQDRHSQNIHDLHTYDINSAQSKQFNIKTEVIEQRELTIPLYLTGHIEPDTGCEVDVSARIAGRLTKILVKPGERVTKGQLMAMIDSREVAELEGEMLEAKSKLDIAQAHAERERQVYEEQIARPKALLEAKSHAAHAKVKLDLAQNEFHRVDDLYKEKIAAAKDFVAAKAVVAEAKLEMEQAQTSLQREENLYDNRVLMKKDYQLAMAEVTREKQHLSTIIKRLEFIGADRKLTLNVLKTGDMNGLARIVAPVDGILNRFEFAAGELVHPEDSIFKITDLQTVQVYADLPEVDLRRVKIGDPVKIKVTSYPGEYFSGTISLIAQHVNLETRSLPVHARLTNHGGRLKPNMHAEIDLVSTSGLSLACPKSAVYKRDGMTIVLLKRAGGLEERAIKVGAATSYYQEVLEGVTAGDEVVLNAAHAIEILRRQ